MISELNVGDVLAVGTAGWAADVIRLGEDIGGKPSPANHVVIVHHVDAAARWWGICGQPGGVGWVDIRQYTRGGELAQAGNSDAALPRTHQQREQVAAAALALIGTPYDWVAGIGADALGDLRAKRLAAQLDRWWGWRDPQNPEAAPGHIACSSLAAWIHDSLGLPGPGGPAEIVQPSDWWLFNAALGKVTA